MSTLTKTIDGKIYNRELILKTPSTQISKTFCGPCAFRYDYKNCLELECCEHVDGFRLLYVWKEVTTQ